MSRSDSELKVLWHWQTMGPYHFARMKALADRKDLRLTVVETCPIDDHGWRRDETGIDGFQVVRLSDRNDATQNANTWAFAQLLAFERPDIVVAAGYAWVRSLMAILRYRYTNPASVALIWSESTSIDHPRKRLKEALKSVSVRAFDGGLVAGQRHEEYLINLGMNPSDIGVVGNCVDNEFFRKRTADERERLKNCPKNDSFPANFFLYVGRMIPEKNLSRLLEAYRLYRERAAVERWDLVLVGSGSEEISLRQQVESSAIQGVWFAGLRQVDELPSYYARAKCFVLPSISEPWGLVVNEAMASGLPVLVSSRCGCAADLVRHGVNGFVFDPLDVHGLANLLSDFSGGNINFQALGKEAQASIAGYSPFLFAERAATHLRALHDRARKMALRHGTVRLLMLRWK